MRKNPEAYQLAKDHESYMSKSSLYLWGGLSLAISYLAFSGKNYNQGLYWGIFGSGLGMSLYEKSKGNDALTKALTIYNQEF
ncbi:MAG: hypothetical protein ACK5V3_13735 [Bdellovibrionales bacterium]